MSELTGRSSMLTTLRWTVVDGLALVSRELGHVRRAPGLLIASLIFPAIMVVMFGYVFGSAISVPGGGNYREYLIPGLFAMITFTAVMSTTMIVAADAERGVMDRFRSMPVARSAVPFGWTGADALTGLVGLMIMVGCGAVVGWRAHEGLWRTLAAFGLLVLLRYALSWVGVYLGLVVRNEETADKMIPLVFPVTMLSNSYVPTGGMPAWLRAIADWNPVSAVVAACRQLFGNPTVTTGVSWPQAHPVTATLCWTALLLVIFVPLSIRQYQRKGR
jgi:ABC-2 type transport system permease protein